MPKPDRPNTTKLTPLSTRFDHALLFAAQVHRNQERKKSGIPYISHLLGVAAIVLDYGGDEDMGIAALLHDAAEDHGGKAMLAAIEQMFGARVAKIVDGCTDSYGDEGKNKPKWYPRKLRYIRRVRNEDAETRFVSAADKLYNARAVLRDVRQSGRFGVRKLLGSQGQGAVVLPLAGAGVSRGGVTHLLKPLLDDLDRAVTELEHLALVSAAGKVSRNGKVKLKKK